MEPMNFFYIFKTLKALAAHLWRGKNFSRSGGSGK